MILNKIAWSFTNEFFKDTEKFNQAVNQYQMKIFKSENCWKPDEVVFDFPEIIIQYMAWVKGPEDLLENEKLIEDDEDVFDDNNTEDGEFQVEILAKLKANNKYFTALEFLQKTHNQQANKELGDHIFFEGTDENPKINEEGIPVCYISCGS